MRDAVICEPLRTPVGGFGGALRNVAAHELAAMVVRALIARTGLDPRPALPVYLAYNFFRIAAILQGIIGRVRDGTATSEFAPAKAEMIRPLADKGWEFARQA